MAKANSSLWRVPNTIINDRLMLYVFLFGCIMWNIGLKGWQNWQIKIKCWKPNFHLLSAVAPLVFISVLRCLWVSITGSAQCNCPWYPIILVFYFTLQLAFYGSAQTEENFLNILARLCTCFQIFQPILASYELPLFFRNFPICFRNINFISDQQFLYAGGSPLHHLIYPFFNT